ncbi:YihY/virulence factor BrkB family protein [Sphingomonas sp.]|uniref:YihY/virulence factor BrkB family protein n=1 Tax=Sphingomonas sp. TaxID=28214 RepID=UPI002DEDB22D|nr:YihY/virulence factor BrkB family protein [Sphingomonas sp.]
MDLIDETQEVELPHGPAPQTPEARRRRLLRTRKRVDDTLKKLGPGSRVRVVLGRAFEGVWNDGFIHAGNLAFLTLLTLFPFFIVVAAIAQTFGRDAATLDALRQFLAQVPSDVAKVLEKPISDVLTARSGSLLWLGALGGLWSTGGFVATLKDILYRAYGVRSASTFWAARLRYTAITIGSVLLVLVSFLLQAVLAGLEQFVVRLFPFSDESLLLLLSASRLIPGLFIFGAFYLLFYVMTPRRYRGRGCRKYPGPLFITFWWLLVTSLLPPTLTLLGGYDLTYGSLAGVMIALVYFFTLGLGVVFGAHLNAALAEVPQSALKDAQPQPEVGPSERTDEGQARPDHGPGK